MCDTASVTVHKGEVMGSENISFEQFKKSIVDGNIEEVRAAFVQIFEGKDLKSAAFPSSILGQDLVSGIWCPSICPEVGNNAVIDLGNGALVIDPMQFATLNGWTDVCKRLLESGWDVNAVDPFFRVTPLHTAASFGFEDLLEVLISLGASIDTQAYDGQTPLYSACLSNRLDCVTALVKAGADISLPASDGSLPIHIAAETNNVKMVQVLLEHGNTPDTVSFPF